MFSPFRGLVFDRDLVGSPGAVTSPPYDVIDDSDRRRLLADSPYNVVRVLLAEEGDERYQRVAARLRRWRDAGVLVPDDQVRLFIYEIDHLTPDNTRVTARGVLGGLGLEPLGGRVLGHEETMDKHRADRMAVLTATRANLDVIVGLSAAPRLASLLLPDGPPRLEFEVGSERHRLFDISDDDRIAEIGASIGESTVSIADGHHRYTTALSFAEAQGRTDAGRAPWRRILAFVAPAEGSGLRIAPYHRMFDDLPFDAESVGRSFEVEPSDPHPPDVAGDLVLVTGSGSYRLRARDDTLAVLPVPWRAASAAVARELLYPVMGIEETDAEYTADRGVALSRVAAGGTALLVAPVAEAAIAAASEAGIRFPQKSTFFTPKPRAGLVIRAFDLEG